MGKRDSRYAFVNPLAAARSKGAAPSTRTSTEEYLNRPRITLDDALEKMRADKGTLAQWEDKMSEGFRKSLADDREKRLAESQAKATQKAEARAQADQLQRAMGMLRQTDGSGFSKDVQKEKTLGKDNIPAITIIKTVKSTKTPEPVKAVIEKMTKGKLPTTTIVKAVKPQQPAASTAKSSLESLDEKTLRRALRKANSAVKSAGPTNAATAGALASFEKELKRRKKQKRNEAWKKKHSKKSKHHSVSSDSAASSLSSSSPGEHSSSGDSTGSGEDMDSGRHRHRHKRKRRRHSGSEDSDSDASPDEGTHQRKHRHKRKKKHHRQEEKFRDSDSALLPCDEAEQGKTCGDGYDSKVTWTEVSYGDAGVSKYSSERTSSSSHRRHKHRSKRKRHHRSPVLDG